MKKFLTTMVAFLALALTACGGGNGGGNESVPESKEQVWETNGTNHWHVAEDGSKVDNAKHDFGEKYDEVAATCQQEGSYKQKCSVCGYEKTTKVNKTEHSWGEWVVKDATCGEPGTRTRECSICHEKESETLGKLPHSWEVKNTIAKSGEDDMAYDEVECSVCHKKGIWVACKDMTIDGTDKGGAPEGCVKLSSNGQSMTAKINLAAAKSGTLFLRGVMDYWHDGNNDNQNKTYSSCKNSNPANFSFEVNDVALDFSDKYDIPFSDMLPEEAGETVGSVAYSQLGDCEVAAVSLNAGANTLKFTRVDSYNLAVKYFLVVYND